MLPETVRESDTTNEPLLGAIALLCDDSEDAG